MFLFYKILDNQDEYGSGAILSKLLHTLACLTRRRPRKSCSGYVAHAQLEVAPDHIRLFPLDVAALGNRWLRMRNRKCGSDHN